MFIVFLQFLSVNFRTGLTHLICDKDDFTLSAWYDKELDKGYKFRNKLAISSLLMPKL